MVLLAELPPREGRFRIAPGLGGLGDQSTPAYEQWCDLNDPVSRKHGVNRAGTDFRCTNARGKATRLMKSHYFDALDVGGAQPVRPTQVGHHLQRRLGPSAARIGFAVLLLRMRQRWPRSDHRSAKSGSSAVIAGAPVKVSDAR